MNRYTNRQYVEIFHLLFLDQLGRKIDKRYPVLKGGCNLRFFMRSPRYSEDMDLDVAGIPSHKLRDRVNSILNSKPFAQILQTRVMRLSHITEAKQTETTQRWKLGLAVPGIETPLPTRIEFSRRNPTAEAAFDPIDPVLIRAYELAPVMTHHYPGPVAFRQKIEALTGRREVQARDIFDLDILLRAGVDVGPEPHELPTRIAGARENILAVDYPVFKSHVLAYLPADEQGRWDEEAWDALRDRVLEALEKGGR